MKGTCFSQLCQLWRLDARVLTIYKKESIFRAPDGGGGHSYIKMRGVLVRCFLKNTLKDTRISFNGRGSNGLLTLKKYQF